MAQAYRIKPTPKRDKRFNAVDILPYLGRAFLESGFLIFIGCAVYLLIALLTYQPTDPAWTHTAPGVAVANRAGALGAWFADVSFYFFGYFAYLFPLGVAYCGWRLFRSGMLWELDAEIILFRLFGFLITISSGCGLAALQLGPVEGLPSGSAGGIFGGFIAAWLSGAFPILAATAFLLVLFAAGVTLTTGFSWLDILDGVGTATMNVTNLVSKFVLQTKAWVEAEDMDDTEAQKTEPALTPEPAEQQISAEPALSTVDSDLEFIDPGDKFAADEPPTRRLNLGKRIRREPNFAAPEEASLPTFAADTLPPESDTAQSRTFISAIDRHADKTGPTRQLDLSTPPISLLEPPAPGQIDALRTLLAAQAYQANTTGLPLILGYDDDGRPCVIDLLQLPNLLAAGDDRNALTQLLHTFLLSLLYKSKPQSLRLILLDSATSDLAVYHDIPHLFMPIATSIEQAVNALVWCKKEIDHRERLLADQEVPDVATLNRVMVNSSKGFSATSVVNPSAFQPLPSVVVVIAELADIVEVMGDWVDTLFAKLSVKGQHTGVHLLLATHRPSAETLSPTLKAGLPARVALRVNSEDTSQHILDSSDAAQLSATELLYLAPNTDSPQVLRTALVGLPEVERVTTYLRQLEQTNIAEPIKFD